MNVALIGQRGSGKTTVGRLVASALGWGFVDTDDMVEARAALTIAEVFRGPGEASFRAMEAEAVAEAASRDRVVIALGGGAVLWPGNVETLRGRAVVVWLKADAATLAKRLASDLATPFRRPALAEADLTDRDRLYASAADVVVEAGDAAPEEVARRVSAAVSRRLEEPWY